MIKEMGTVINRPFNDKRMRFILARFRYPIAGLLFILFILYIHNIKFSFLLSGFLVSIFGELIQVWSFGSLEKNKILVDRGPYRIVRNPMYIGRYFVLLGIVLLTANPFVFILYTIFFSFYAFNRVKREEKVLREHFGEAYKHYCKEVNRFLPSLRRPGAGNFRYFNPDLFIKNNGHLNLILVLFIYFSIYFFVLI